MSSSAKKLPAKKPALAESLLGLRVRCQRVHPWDLEPDALAGAVHQVNDILDDLLILLQDEALQHAPRALELEFEDPEAHEPACIDWDAIDRDRALQSAKAGKPQATKKAQKSAKPKTNR